MPRRIFYIDLLERMAWTFVQAFAAEWILTGDFGGDALKLGAIAGGLAVAKALIATQVGDPASAATLPSPPDKAPDPVEAGERGQSAYTVAVVALIIAVVCLVLIL